MTPIENLTVTCSRCGNNMEIGYNILKPNPYYLTYGHQAIREKVVLEISSFIDINCIAYDGIASNTQVDNGEPAYGDVGGKTFDQVMAEWDVLIKEVRESE